MLPATSEEAPALLSAQSSDTALHQGLHGQFWESASFLPGWPAFMDSAAGLSSIEQAASFHRCAHLAILALAMTSSRRAPRLAHAAMLSPSCCAKRCHSRRSHGGSACLVLSALLHHSDLRANLEAKLSRADATGQITPVLPYRGRIPSRDTMMRTCQPPLLTTLRC